MSHSECTRPPEGWHCFQREGHEGPCPAHPCPWPNHHHELDWSDCWSHHRSEHIGRRTFKVCFECGHVWTRLALWWAWVRAYGGWHPRRMFKRPSKIFFCQECIHDF